METLDLYKIELEDEFGKIKDIEIESDERRKVVGDISQLTDRLVKLKEVENEREKIAVEREKVEAEKEKWTIEREKVEVEKEKLTIEREKADAEKEKLSIEQQKLDIEEKQLEEDRKSRVINHIMTGLGIAIPAGITLTGMVLMFIFEERGTITSKAGGKIVDRIFRMK